MMKTPFLISFFCLGVTVLSGQVEIEWTKSYGGSEVDEANSIQQTIDGGYVVAGRSLSNDDDVSGNHGLQDYWIIKLDADGMLEWQKSYGGSGTDVANCIQQTNDGGYIVAGYSRSSDGDVGGNKGENDYWIVKLYPDGELEWKQNYGGSDSDVAQWIQQTKEGGYIVAGHSSSSDGDVRGNNGESDYWIVKLYADGRLDWEESYGGSDIEIPEIIQQTNDEGYIVAGTSLSDDIDVGGNKGSTDYWVVKLDTIGNIEWEENYGGSGGESAFSIQQTNEGGYIVAGVSISSDGDISGNKGIQDYWIIKLNTIGNIEWRKNYGGSRADYAYSVQQTSEGGYIVAGYSLSGDVDVNGNNGQHDYWIIKLRANGELEWEKNYGGSGIDIANSMQQINDEEYIVAGRSSSSDIDVGGNNGKSDYWIVKLRPCPVYMTTVDTIVCYGENVPLTDTLQTRYGCDSIITYNVTEWPTVEAGSDTATCEPAVQLSATMSSDTMVWLSGQMVNIEVTGQWSSVDPGPIFDDASDPNTSVTGLNPGENKLILTLRTEISGIPIQICSKPVQDTVIITYLMLESAEAGTDTTLCKSMVVLQARDPAFPVTGSWRSLNPGPDFDNPSLPSTTVNNLNPGENQLVWTLSHPSCPNYDEDIVNVNYLVLENAEAGTDLTTCGPEIQLAASKPINPVTGKWSSPNSGLDFQIADLPNTKVSNLDPGVNQLIWTLSHPSCPDYDKDTVLVNYLIPESANAGTDQTACGPEIQLAASTPTNPITGRWTSNNAGIGITSPNNPRSGVTTLNSGTNLLIWTLSHPSCPDYDRDTVVVTHLALPNARAGTDISTCDPEAMLNARIPPDTLTGKWTSNTGVSFVDMTDPITEISDLRQGSNTLTWTLSHPLCPGYSSDEVVVNYDGTGIEAVNDVYAYESGVLSGNFLDNDVLSAPGSVEISTYDFQNENTGTLNIGNSGNFTFEMEEPTLGLFVAFSYQITNKSCPEQFDMATVKILLQQDLSSDEDIPLVFTPNGDGINDTFIIPELEENPEDFPRNSLVVINRWGDVVFEAKPYNNDWDGTHYKTGKKLPPGTYFYIARLHIANGLVRKEKVTLIR